MRNHARLHALINPIGVIPIYLNLVQEAADVKSRVTAALWVAAGRDGRVKPPLPES